MNAGFVQRLADVILMGRRIEGNRNLRAALEVHTFGDPVPEQHAQYARHGKNQREAEEIPLLAQPIDICVTKQFHLKLQFSVLSSVLSCQFPRPSMTCLPENCELRTSVRSTIRRRVLFLPESRRRSHAKRRPP